MDWNAALERFMPILENFAVDFVVALLILIVGWYISRLVGRGVRGLAHRSKAIDFTAVPMIEGIITWGIRILVIVVVLSQFGIQTTSLIAALGAAGLAIGLALQGTLQNIAAGIMLIALRPIRTGENVTILTGNVTGVVYEIGLFLTRIIRHDGIHVSLPNSVVWNSTIINFSRNQTRRQDILVSISYGDDLDRAIEILQEVAKTQEGVSQEQAPSVFVSEYRDSVVIVTVRVWTEAPLFASVQAELLKRTRQALEQERFRLPFPTQIMHANMQNSDEEKAAASEGQGQ